LNLFSILFTLLLRFTLFPYTTLFRSSISNMDGLVLTIVSMLVVFIVLAAIWGLVEMVSALISRQEPTEESTKTSLTTSHPQTVRSEEHTSELQSRFDLVCRLLLEKKK